MKKILRTSLQLMSAMLFPVMAFGQSSDYSILLNSGKFLPTENTKTLNQDSETLRNSLFKGKYYVGLQFKAIPVQAQKDQLAAAGVILHDYLPNLAYLASVPQHVNPAKLAEFGVRSVFRLTSTQKTVPALLKGDVPDHAVKIKGFADVTVTTYEPLALAIISEQLTQTRAEVLEEMEVFRSFTVRVPVASLGSLIEQPFVQWVEPIDPPNAPENSKGRTLHRVNGLQDGTRNLKGDGIKIGIWDGNEVSPHIDFSPTASRVLIKEATGVQSDHGTHCAGIIAGRGLINPKAKGMAPNSVLYSYNYSGTVSSEVSSALANFGLNISSHSYGQTTVTCGLTGANVVYSSTSRSTDINLNNYPSHLHVHSAGNSQTGCTDGWTTITGSGKSAKNNIVVANISTTEAISGSSSFGPVHDGRVKPELSALGTSVFSTYTPLNAYGTLSGTSMATPGVAGSLALVVQRYKQLKANALPISSLVKAIACNTAHDLGNPGPDYKFGFGRINTLEAVRTIEEARYVTSTIANGAIQYVTITVPSGATKLKVTAAWNDPAAASNASVALVNNLNLEVQSGTTYTYPWKLDKNLPANPATRGIDNVSNIEQITIDNPVAGVCTLRVRATSVPVGPQEFSLTWQIEQPGLEVIYPNGGESLAPATYEYITWNNPGVTGTQTLQYSVDNGTTWTTISSTIAATATRYNWYVPSTLNTANALIRVSSGTLSDQSDAPFQTLRIPTGLAAAAGTTSGTVNLTWNATTNATHYDILSLSTTTGTWSTYASNIVGTAYTTPVLTAGSNRWFTIIAKNTTLGTVSDRAVAVNHVVGSTARLAGNGSDTGGRLATADELKQIMLYPNPTEGKFAISYDREAGEELKVTVYDSRGAQIRLPQSSLRNTENGTEVDLSRYGKGIYLIYLHLPNGEKVASEKVMVY